MAKIIAVCRSEKKGTRKENIGCGLFKGGFGLIDDAHSDWHTHRQVSLLAIESINKMRAMGLDLVPGDFAENLNGRLGSGCFTHWNKACGRGRGYVRSYPDW